MCPCRGASARGGSACAEALIPCERLCGGVCRHQPLEAQERADAVLLPRASDEEVRGPGRAAAAPAGAGADTRGSARTS